jgi:hypothetical protein
VGQRTDFRAGSVPGPPERLDTQSLRPGQRIDFTFQGLATGEWEGRDYSLVVEPDGNVRASPASRLATV